MTGFRYGYAMNDALGDKRIVTPPMLGEKITLSLGHTSTFVFLGTKAEILEWFRTEGQNKSVHIVLFYDRPKDDPLAPKVDVVFDLLAYPNPDLTWTQWYQSWYKSDPTLELYRLELRPEQPKIDSEMEPLYRMYAKSGVTLGGIADALETKWSGPPEKSYLDMAREIFYEREDVHEHAQEVAAHTKASDEVRQGIDLEDIVVSVPTDNVRTTAAAH
ncbi:hypothetical protein DFQ26_008518 [Actinomortierella ambigua]|nr:hypothetical protein DFQ26_008518 [Actinomortierella ambigua]